jgi:molybdenum transport protein
MIYFTNSEIDQLLTDDAPLGDHTTRALGIDHQPAELSYFSRSALTVSGTEEVLRIAQRLGVQVEDCVPSGQEVSEGQNLFTAKGRADALHQLWRAGLTMLEYGSGIASRTAALCQVAKDVNPEIVIAGTRKHPPYLKKVALKALIAGGGTPHRVGLSDTILIFSEHLTFMPDLESAIARAKAHSREKKVVTEAHNVEDAIRMTKAGSDAIQMDKTPPEVFRNCVLTCRSINPSIIIIAAGGINTDNASAYSKAGADVLVTSCMYFSPPANIGVKLKSE